MKLEKTGKLMNFIDKYNRDAYVKYVYDEIPLTTCSLLRSLMMASLTALAVGIGWTILAMLAVGLLIANLLPFVNFFYPVFDLIGQQGTCLSIAICFVTWTIFFVILREKYRRRGLLQNVDITFGVADKIQNNVIWQSIKAKHDKVCIKIDLY